MIAVPHAEHSMANLPGVIGIVTWTVAELIHASQEQCLIRHDPLGVGMRHGEPGRAEQHDRGHPKEQWNQNAEGTGHRTLGILRPA